MNDNDNDNDNDNNSNNSNNSSNNKNIPRNPTPYSPLSLHIMCVNLITRLLDKKKNKWGYGYKIPCSEDQRKPE